jgi:3-oxoacyl-[acyl-carrier-protein] synthase II
MPQTCAVNVSVFFGTTGRIITTNTACTSGSLSIGYAYEAIKYGMQDVMIAGGADELDATESAVFDTLFATSVKNDTPELTPAPFDRDRDGLVIGEGAGTLILEEYEHAKARGAHIYAEVVGYGANSDAYHMTSPAPHGEFQAKCMQLALDDAGMKAEEVDYVNAHGTSTHLNDQGETEAIKAVWGEAAKNVSVSSIKSMTGHMLGAAGGVEAIATAMAIENDMLPPTINYETPDEGLDLDYVPNKAKAKTVRAAMSNSFGFGGHNACLLLKKYAE